MPDKKTKSWENDMNGLKILIIGGGVAGLAAMKTLRNVGFDPVLVEKADKIQTDGTGILLGINAVKLLTDMGLGTTLDREGMELFEMTAFDEKGYDVASCDLRYIESQSGYKTYGVHRESLSNMLLDNDQNIKTGKKVIAVQNYKHAVQVSFEDGSVEICDLVIGADGANSDVRASLFGDIDFRDAKQGCWRFTAKTPDDFNKQGIFEYFGVGKRAGYMPLKDGRLYGYVLLNQNMYDKQNMPNLQTLLKHFEGFEGDWQMISKALMDSQKIVFNEIKDLSKICITQGRVVLIGDAAHAVTPNLGQGAAMGIEDAYLLANILKSSKTVDEALSLFEKKRYKRVKSIRDKSFLIGKIAQSSSSIFCAVRNMIYRLMPSQTIAKDTLKTISLPKDF